MLLSAALALMLTVPASIAFIAPAVVSHRHWESLSYLLGLGWAVSTGWATLPWSLVGAVMGGLLGFGRAGHDIGLEILGVWLCYFLNFMYALTRWEAGRLFSVVSKVAVLQIVVFSAAIFFIVS
jgi:hypothetical protein